MFQNIDAVCSSATADHDAMMKRADQVGPLYAEARKPVPVSGSARCALTSAVGHLTGKVRILVDSVAGDGRPGHLSAGRSD